MIMIYDHYAGGLLAELFEKAMERGEREREIERDHYASFCSILKCNPVSRNLEIVALLTNCPSFPAATRANVQLYIAYRDHKTTRTPLPIPKTTSIYIPVSMCYPHLCQCELCVFWQLLLSRCLAG